jgi:hypothetical protein
MIRFWYAFVEALELRTLITRFPPLSTGFDGRALVRGVYRVRVFAEFLNRSAPRLTVATTIFVNLPPRPSAADVLFLQPAATGPAPGDIL